MNIYVLLLLARGVCIESLFGTTFVYMLLSLKSLKLNTGPQSIFRPLASRMERKPSVPKEDSDLALNIAAEAKATSVSSSSASAKAPPSRPKVKRYYTLYGWSRHPACCGIYHGLFDSLKAALLGESLEGASLKGFDTEQEALDFWYSHTCEDVTVTEI